MPSENLLKRKDSELKSQSRCTFINMLSDSQHTCARVSDLLFLNCHSFSQDMTRFSYIIMSRHILCMLLSKSSSLRCSSSRVLSEMFHSWRRRWILIYCCSFLMHVVQIANHQYHLLLLQLPPYANQTIRAFEILSFFFLLHFSSFFSRKRWICLTWS